MAGGAGGGGNVAASSVDGGRCESSKKTLAKCVMTLVTL
jgi:hypothetical protein